MAAIMLVGQLPDGSPLQRARMILSSMSVMLRT
jgi:hypothetical protein